MSDTHCISEADLQAYLLGKLPERMGRSVAAHLEGCSDCDAQARRLDERADPLIDCLRHALGATASIGGTSAIGSAVSAAPVGVRLPARMGAYTVLDEVGHGGMAVVYKARQDRPSRLVALKVLLAGSHSSAERRARFRAEADAIARLRHPNIVQVYEAGEQDGLPFLALEFCEGGSLAKHLAGTPQPPRPAAQLAEQLARAVEHAHQAGIVHRDLKPANVLLTADGQPKVSDFGLAKGEGSELTATGAVLGTPSYMAPEQADGRREVGPVADVYSLGAILYELLTGRPPFQGATALETLEQVRGQEPVPPRRLQPKVPRDLETICLKCLEKEPARRYTSAGALADDLRRFQENRPVQARPVGTVGRSWRWARRNPGWAIALASIAGLLLAVAIVSSAMTWQLNEALGESERDRIRATDAELAGKYRLWEAYLAQARAIRSAGRKGQRFEALAAIRKALDLPVPLDRSLAELRDEAIACLVLADIEPAPDHPGRACPAGGRPWFALPSFEGFAYVDREARLGIRRWTDDTDLVRLPEPARVDATVVSPDSRFVAHRHPNAVFKLWRIDGAVPVVVCTCPARGPRTVPGFRADSGRMAVEAADGTVRVFDTATGQELRRLNPHGAHMVAFRPGRPHLAVFGGEKLQVFDLDSGKVVATLPQPVVGGELDWHPDGAVLAAACDDLKIRLWDVDRQRLLVPPLEGHRTVGIHVCFNRRGDRLVSNDWDACLRLWDAHTGRLLLSSPTVARGLFSPDDRYLFLGEARDGVARLMHVAPGRELDCRVVSNGSANRYFKWAFPTPDDRLLVVGTMDALMFIDRARGVELAEVPLQNTMPFAFDPDGALLTKTSGGPVRRWPMRTDPATGMVQVGPPQVLYPNCNWDGHAISADGKVLSIAAHSRGLVLHRPDRLIQLAPRGDVRFSAVSPDGRWVATGNFGMAACAAATVWDAHSGALVWEMPLEESSMVGFSPDPAGRWLVTTAGGYRLWRTGSWTPGPPIVQVPGENGVFSWFAFSRDGKVLAIAAGFSRVRLINPDTGVALACLSVPDQTIVQPLAFSCDGAELIAVGNHVLYTWDLRAIRAQLKPLGLDWDAPAYPPPAPAPARPLRVQVEN